MDVEAKYYRVVDDRQVQCLLCPHTCTIREAKSGQCGVRVHKGGKLVSTIYGEVTAVSMDPIEKKPLYHFHPGSSILSIGTKGCNFKCLYCQNWHISQELSVSTSYYPPEDIVQTASRKGSVGIAYTYSEPMIWFEYVYDCCRLARDKNLKNVFVTNGFINQEPLAELLEYADAMNIDLKSFREDTYKRFQKGSLEPVLRTIEEVHRRGCHLELTTLIVTDMNDDMAEMQDIINWIASLDVNIPWHISRYYPSYRYDAPATDIDFMLQVYDEAIKKLNHVFCGNISGSYGRSDTLCPACKTVVISRSGYQTRIKQLDKGTCGNCGHDLKIVQ
jgi:pyruvate formate lyase activating enzyme